jgi:RNA recognition motif-containing protein
MALVKKKDRDMDIYVGNLAYSTNDESLRSAFSAYGEVASARVVSDRMTGRSKGFGFVEMPDRAQAQAAIDALNGKELDSRTLRVNESQPKPREERGGSGGGGFRGGAGGGGGGGGGFRGGAGGGGGGRGGAGGRGGERRESRW